MTEYLDREWDLIVVGTGMGGATLGRALAEKGWSVLFLEKGRRGFRAEQQSLSPAISDPVARLVRGCWPEMVSSTIDGREHSFHAPLGCGVGGSSVFYAGTLERPEPRDLDHSEAFPHPTGGWLERAVALDQRGRGDVRCPGRVLPDLGTTELSRSNPSRLGRRCSHHGQASGQWLPPISFGQLNKGN